MTASRANGTAEGSPVREHPAVADRITVALVPKAGEGLQHLIDRTGLSKTDLVNRALILYEFIDAQQADDRELLLRNRKTGETQAVVIL
jgi:hypothetical protein